MKLPNLFLFTGEETFLLQQKLKFWKEKFQEKHGDINMSVIDATGVRTSAIVVECSAQPFLAEKRLVVVENYQIPKAPAEKTKNNNKDNKELKDSKDEILHFTNQLKKIPESTICIFVMPKCDKRTKWYSFFKDEAKIENFDVLTESEMALWIRKKVKEYNLHINDSACRVMINNCQGRLWNLASELQKTFLYLQASGQNTISVEILDEVTVRHLEADIFQLTDVLGKRDAVAALQIFARLCENGEDLMFIFHMLVRHFRLLTLVKNCQNLDQNKAMLLKTFKIHPFVFKKILQQLVNFSVYDLQIIYQELLAFEVSLKDGSMSFSAQELPNFFALALEKWIIKYLKQKI